MSRKIKTINIDTDSIISSRDIIVNESIRSIDVNQLDGSILATYTTNTDGTYNGSVVMYPQSSALQVDEPITIDDLDRFGSLYYPNDAKFNYLRRKIWICDTGNHRVLKINRDTQEVDISIENKIYYPYALVVDLNDNGVFVRGYDDIQRRKSVVRKFYSDGDDGEIFKFDTDSSDASSSSSSSQLLGSSSSSSDDLLPEFPFPSSIVYDHVRSRTWWVNETKIYMADSRYKNIQIYDLNSDGYINAYSIDVQLDNGNVLVVADDIHSERFLVQVYKDNNLLLASSYIV